MSIDTMTIIDVEALESRAVELSIEMGISSSSLTAHSSSTSV